MSSPRKNRDRVVRSCLVVAASAAVLFAGHALPAAPLGVAEFAGDLYDFDLSTGEYSLAVPLDPPVECGPLTGGGDTLFCADPEQFEGTWVRRLERSSASVVWEVVFPDLSFPDGIAITDSLLYVVTHANQATDYFLLTLDPSTGQELARIELPELGGFQVAYALAARGSELWILITGDFTGMSIRRLDPLTGSLHESFTIPGVFSACDAEFDADGRLFVSYLEWNPINTGWCTDHWTVPYLGASPQLRFTHCWELPDPPVPKLDYFTLADPEEATPIVDVPTLGTVAACLLVVLLSLSGILSLRQASGISSL